MAAVAFLGEDFSFINGIGLVVLIAGVAVFNISKYQKIKAAAREGGTRTPRASGLEHAHRRTSSEAREAFGDDYMVDKGGPPVSPLATSRESTVKLQAANISGPASHRRDLANPPV